MDLGVVCCMTSNYRPDDLYKDGLKRENFLPTIALLKERLDVLHVDGGVDYRQRMLEGVKVYHAPLGEHTDRALLETFGRIAEVEEEFHELDVEGRVIPYRHRAGGVVWFDFKVICGWGRSQHDYLDLSKRFHTVIVSEVPRMGLALAEEARRFTLMVDVFYDNRVKLIVSAETAPESSSRSRRTPATRGCAPWCSNSTAPRAAWSRCNPANTWPSAGAPRIEKRAGARCLAGIIAHGEIQGLPHPRGREKGRCALRGPHPRGPRQGRGGGTRSVFERQL